MSDARETRRDYRRPFRPFPLGEINRLLGPILHGPLAGSLEPEALMAEAARAVGWDDFGDPSFRAPLAHLVRSIEAEANLNPIGRLITRTRLVATLKNRLRVEQAHAKRRALGGIRIERPIFVVGMQRTGTTLLHRLLSADSRNRALYSWEALNPVAIPPTLLDRARGLVRGDTRDPRIAVAELSEKALAFMAPDFFAIHPVEAHAPEEDVLLLDLSFLSTVAEATMRVPSFASWLEQQDQLPAYRYEERVLQILTDASPPKGGRWVLKTPHHLEWLDVLKAVFPDALLVWTHRDPVTTIASFCSMVAHGRGVFSDAVDPVEVGRDWSRKVKRMVDNGMAAREKLGDADFVDVKYKDLVKDPMATMRRVYERAGLTVTPAAEAEMQALLAEQTQHKHGVHHYDLADFGLSEDGIKADLARYRGRYC